MSCIIPPSRIFILPPEIFNSIASFLSVANTRALSRSCKRLHSLLDHACCSASGFTVINLPGWHPSCDLTSRFRNEIKGRVVEKALLVIRAEIKWVHGEWIKSGCNEAIHQGHEFRARGKWVLVEQENSGNACACGTTHESDAQLNRLRDLRILILLNPKADPPTDPPGPEYEHPDSSPVLGALQNLLSSLHPIYGLLNLQVVVRTDTPENATTHSRLVSRAPFKMVDIELQSLLEVIDYEFYAVNLQSTLQFEPPEEFKGEDAQKSHGIVALRAKLAAGQSLEGEEPVCMECASCAAGDASFPLGPRMWKCSFVNRVWDGPGVKFPGDQYLRPRKMADIATPMVEGAERFPIRWRSSYPSRNAKDPPDWIPSFTPPDYSLQWHRYPLVHPMVESFHYRLRPTSAQFILSHLHLEGIELEFKSFRGFKNFCPHRGRLILRDVRLKDEPCWTMAPHASEGLEPWPWHGSYHYRVMWHTFASWARWMAADGDEGWKCEVEGLWENRNSTDVWESRTSTDGPRKGTNFVKLSRETMSFIKSIFAGPRDWRNVPSMVREAERLRAIEWHKDCNASSYACSDDACTMNDSLFTEGRLHRTTIY